MCGPFPFEFLGSLPLFSSFLSSCLVLFFRVHPWRAFSGACRTGQHCTVQSPQTRVENLLLPPTMLLNLNADEPTSRNWRLSR